ncbi:hypothetical protein [Parasitella parasitica]|uniref:Uncharacterized protein n=1 Tax=Parasitella parasitica TaxID=35722 RepID=A0A0B7N5R0_9FUNG|nr:hypothetical protein [Parasitella parasitica]
MNNNNNNVNESIVRLLQEVSAIGNETMLMHATVRNLEAQFSQQSATLGLSQMMLAAGSNIATMAESLLVVDQQARTPLIIAPDRRGPREIALNPTGVPRAGLRMRYDVMQQALQGRKFPDSPPLAAGQLRTLGLAMHHEASKLLPTFLVIVTQKTGWDQLYAEYQFSFALLLEDKMSQLTRAENARRREEEEDVVGGNERSTHTPANNNNGSANNADNDDNESTTSNAI